MESFPDRRVTDLLGIEHPLFLAPMAGSGGSSLAVAVARAGGLGAIPCASLPVEAARAEVGVFRQAGTWPLNLNFFAHVAEPRDANRETRWRERLAPYYREFGVRPPESGATAAGRAPFDEAMCRFVEEVRPEVVSFHFGLPAEDLLQRVRATGARIVSSATTVEEARWLAARRSDLVIAQGSEAGGHRATFLGLDMTTQPSTFSLLPRVVDAVDVPVIAAGGIADGRAIVAALALGASGVQLGTAFLLSPEATTTPVHRAALAAARDDDTAITDLFTGRPARGIVNRLMRELGPMGGEVPAFPTAGAALAPLRAVTEPRGVGDFQPLWAGQSVSATRSLPAEQLARDLIEAAIGSY